MQTEVQESSVEGVIYKYGGGVGVVEKTDHNKEDKLEVQVDGQKVDQVRTEYDGRPHLPQDEGQDHSEQVEAQAEEDSCA